MNENNYLHIPKSQHNEKIYRIMPLYRLFELFDKKQNVLVKPEKWEDPFENFIIKSPKVFGQCWSRHKASDAMWRIYSSYPNYHRCSDCSKCPKCSKNPKDLIPVRIRSTVRKVAESLTGIEKVNNEVFIGRVRYLKDAELEKEYNKNKISNPKKLSAKNLAESLLLKRRAFEHEREIRLIVVADKSDVKDYKFSYSIDPHALVDQIMIDPFLDKREGLDIDYKTLKEEIRKRTGFSSDKILRSLLYQLPSAYKLP